MEKTTQVILFMLLIFDSSVAQNATIRADELPVGVILDLASLVGKIARASISMALEDFYTVHRNYSTKLVLHIRDSNSNNVQAASAALDLLQNYNVQVIIGPQTSSQAAFLSDLGNESQVPVISFTATSPNLYSGSLPYFVRATLDDSAQVKSIASLIKAYGWRQVVLIYEETDYGRGIIPHLIEALQEIDVRVPYRCVIPLSASTELVSQELYKLMTMQARVFVVHMSPDLASTLFTYAKKVSMMNKGFVWIMTDGLTNIIDSMNASVVESINGALGVRFYVPKSAELENFTIRWNRRLQINNPDDVPLKPDIFGLWGYDTIWALAQAVENVGIKNRTFQKTAGARNMTSLETSLYGPDLLKMILQNKIRGLSGYFDLSNRQLQVSTFQIINVVDKGWKEIGFWTAQNGLSRRLNQGKPMIEQSALVYDLNSVIWPGKSTEMPRGWVVPVSGKKLKVGVHVSPYPQFMTNEKDPVTGATKASGLAVDIFEEAVKRLPYALPYEYVAFDNTNDTSSGGYDDFVYQVYLKKYDIAIGDITIGYNRTSYVDFTLPYTESGVAMVVPAKSGINNNTWIFIEPLSRDLWFRSIILFIYTWVILWLLEFLGNNTNVHGKIPRKLGIMTLFSLFGDKDKVEGVLSRIVLIVWVFFFLVLSAGYTANLTTMLTIRQLNPTVTDVHELRKSGEYVGCTHGSYVEGLLEELGFDRSKIKSYNTYSGFYSALSKGSKNGGIAAFVHEVPYIRLFLAKHCKGYIMVPVYKTAGFGYAFPKGTPLVGDISKAILNVIGGDTINQLEKKWIGIGYENNCNNVGHGPDPEKLTADGFRGLFILSGVASTSSLLISAMIYLYEKNKSTKPHQNGDGAEENHSPQEGNEGGRVEENDLPGTGRDQSGQRQETEGEEMHDRCLQISDVRHNGSTVIYRHERGLGTRVAPISSSSHF